MRICQILSNLARLHNYPIGNVPNHKKDRFDAEPKTTQHTQTVTLPYGLNTQTHKIYPKLASLLNPIRPLLKKENITNNKIRWEETHTAALDKIKAEKSKITEKKHFDRQRIHAEYTP